jgi:ankyrin repeat protein
VKTTKGLVNCTNENCTTDDEYRNTPLIYAAINGHVGVVRVLLEGGANIESANAYQQTALHFAAYYGQLEVCRLLLERGAKVDTVEKGKETPLHLAASLGHLPVVTLLVGRGADVWLRNCENQTESDLARKEGKEDGAKWLDSVRHG